MILWPDVVVDCAALTAADDADDLLWPGASGRQSQGEADADRFPLGGAASRSGASSVFRAVPGLGYVCRPRSSWASHPDVEIEPRPEDPIQGHK